MKRIKKVLFVLLVLTIAFSAIITTASAQEAIGMHNGKQVDTDRIFSVITLIGAIVLGSIIATVFISFFAFIRHRRSANIIN